MLHAGRKQPLISPARPRHKGTTGLHQYYSSSIVAARTDAQVSLNFHYAWIFRTNETVVVDRIGVYVTTAVANAVARCGIYRPTSKRNLAPDALVIDSGELDCSTTGLKVASVSVTLRPGLYLISFVNGTAQSTFRCAPADAQETFGHRSSDFEYTNVLVRGFNYAALPNPFGVVNPTVGTACPVMVRFA